MKFCLSIYLVCFSFCASALEDSLMKAIEISAHGNKFQADRLRIIAENLANEDSISLTPGGDPYQRRTIFAKNEYDRKLKTRLVKVRKYSVDKKPFKIKFDPYSPAANDEGYVKLPNVEKIIEKADAMEAQKSYEANLAIMQTSTQMLEKAIESMR
ncbi:MAG: flagellar basal body rod protein FlgC [Rickettsiaceae bacterium]|nr:flagellar basal body rod protein FlgC [Rickettsiaceae bacterium]